MTQIILKNSIDSSQLNVLLGLFSSWNIEAEVMEEKNSEKKNFLRLFSKTRGMWKDYDINGTRLRNEAWGLTEHQEA